MTKKKSKSAGDTPQSSPAPAPGAPPPSSIALPSAAAGGSANSNGSTAPSVAPQDDPLSIIAQVAARRLARVREPELSQSSIAAIEQTAPIIAELASATLDEEDLAAAAPASKVPRAETGDVGAAAASAAAAADAEAPTVESITMELTAQLKRLLKWQRRDDNAIADFAKDIATGAAMLSEPGFVTLVCVLGLARASASPDPRAAPAITDCVLEEVADSVVRAAAPSSGISSTSTTWPAVLRWMRFMCHVALGGTASSDPAIWQQLKPTSRDSTASPAAPAAASTNSNGSVAPVAVKQNEAERRQASSRNAPSAPATNDDIIEDPPAPARAAAANVNAAPIATGSEITALHSVATTGITPAEADGVLQRFARHPLPGGARLLVLLASIFRAATPGAPLPAPIEAVARAFNIDGPDRLLPPDWQKPTFKTFLKDSAALTVQHLHPDIPRSWCIAKRIVVPLDITPGTWSTPLHCMIVTDLRGRPVAVQNMTTLGRSLTDAINGLLDCPAQSSVLFEEDSQFLFASEELASAHPKLVCPPPLPPGNGSLAGAERRQRELVLRIIEPALATRRWLEQYDVRRGIEGDMKVQDRLRFLAWVRAAALTAVPPAAYSTAGGSHDPVARL